MYGSLTTSVIQPVFCWPFMMWLTELITGPGCFLSFGGPVFHFNCLWERLGRWLGFYPWWQISDPRGLSLNIWKNPQIGNQTSHLPSRRKKGALFDGIGISMFSFSCGNRFPESGKIICFDQIHMDQVFHSMYMVLANVLSHHLLWCPKLHATSPPIPKWWTIIARNPLPGRFSDCE